MNKQTFVDVYTEIHADISLFNEDKQISATYQNAENPQSICIVWP